MPYGASVREDGTTEFALWAPAPESVQLCIEDGDGERLVGTTRDDAGWRRCRVPGAGPGTRYRWVIDGELRVPDPASRWNPDGPHGASEVVDPRAFEWDAGWSGRPWHEAVFYELHVGAFTPEGTYAAAAARLPELSRLGITAIELMPLADFPGRRGWGYDGVLPYAPYHGYGRPEELKQFIQAAHRAGLMVFVDVVYNHFGPDGNYVPQYAPAFLSDRHETTWGSAFNFDGPGAELVREYFIHNALYWLEEYRVDGLRLDAVHAIVDDGDPHVLVELSRRVRETCTDRHVHLVLENERNETALLAAPGTPGAYEGQWNDDFHHTLHVHLTGEREGYYAAYDRPLHQLARVLALGYARAPALPPPGAMVRFLQNHDHIGNRAFGERLTVLAPPEAVELAHAICLLAPSPPLLFMGEEFGARTSFLYFTDWDGELREAVRAGREREFAAFAAHRGDAGRHVPDPSDEATFLASRLDWADAETPAGRARQALIARLLEIRRDVLLPQLPRLLHDGHDAAVFGDDAPRGLHMRWRFDGGDALDMIVNLSDAPLYTGPCATADDEIFAMGETSPDALGPWSGRWTFGRLP
jgi:1,4-alpha-glucan branching enzyme/maltooligosyltrehalose trehalohydrolase